MIHSMTGFARCEKQCDWGTLSWELRSVNHRYLEISWRLPEELRPLELEFRKIVTGHLKRGKVECGLRLRWSETALPPLRVNHALISQLAVGVRELAAHFPEMAPVSPLDVLRWPRAVEDEERDSGPVQEAATTLLQEALAELTESRNNEGQRLAELVLDRCRGVAELVSEARARLPEIREGLRKRTLERLAQLEVEPDSERLEQELVLMAQKMDVDEELDRLDGHVEEIRRILEGGGAVGRRLDFLMQELNREANTLASKSLDKDSTRIAVELKVLIEQMREQVQNVE
jgi:uncharacterized protein (TIGR00255 family)